MELAMGAMSALLPKLGELLVEEYDLQKSAKKDLRYLQRELQSMNAALSAVAEVPRHELPAQDRLWAGDVRELSQDIEDIVESFLVSAAGAVPLEDAGRFKVFNVKMASLFKMAKARREIATAVKDIKDQVTEVANRDERYRGRGGSSGVVMPPSATTKTTIDPLLSVLYSNQKIVGIDDARDKIIEKLRERDDVSKQQPMMLSIVGFGGLGKTTLAKTIYDELHKGFDCAAFVSVSRCPDLKKVFKNLLYGLDNEKYKSSKPEDLDEGQLIALLQESLRTKRYFVVTDDIWDTKAWGAIKLAFMGSNCRSRIIITTRNLDVSKECCCSDDDFIHKIQPLSERESRKLFYKRIFGSETGCPSQLEQVCTNILKKCAGVPLAIITLASHLASKPKDQWDHVLQSIGRGLTNGGNMEDMRNILLLSYYNLPSHLKVCFLYLSIFPEDSQIGKERLIRRWLAEGFLQGHEKQGMSLLELGETFFNELINRSLIEPVNIDYEGRAEACRVHDLMLDMMCDLSSEENYVTVLNLINGDMSFHSKVRRLSLQNSMTDRTNTQLATTSMSQVRSFTIFRPAFSDNILQLSRFKVLRVLDLEGCELWRASHGLRSVENLLHLRYLGLRDTGVGLVPGEIGKQQFLQVLDFHGVSTGALPASVVGLKRLICLYLDPGTLLPDGFGNLTTLEELTGGVLCHEGYHVEELGNLTELRVLSFRLSDYCSAQQKLILLESLCKLPKLWNLEITCSLTFNQLNMYDRNIDHMRDWVPPPHLRRLKLDGWFQTLPTWISSSLLPLVSYLAIRVNEVRPEDIQILGTLPSLCYLHLHGRGHEESRARFVVSPDAFPRARQCHFQQVGMVPVFTPGAMPMVQQIRFELKTSDILGGNFDLNIRNFPLIERLLVDLGGKEGHNEAEVALERLVYDHPNSHLKLQIYDGIKKQDFLTRSQLSKTGFRTTVGPICCYFSSSS